MNTLESRPITVSSDSFAEDVLQASRQQTVLVDFWAAWCGPCKALTGPLNEIAAERSGKLIVAKIDVDSNQDLAALYNVRSIPALLAFRDGKVVEMLVGVRPKAEILQRVDAVINSGRVSTAA